MHYGEFISTFLIDLQRLFRSEILIKNMTYSQILAIISIPVGGTEMSELARKLGLDNSLIELPGLTPGMLVTLGEQKILTLNDFADLASDELTGTYDIVKGEKIKIKGYLEDFALTREEADNLIMTARNLAYKD